MLDLLGNAQAQLRNFGDMVQQREKGCSDTAAMKCLPRSAPHNVACSTSSCWLRRDMQV